MRKFTVNLIILICALSLFSCFEDVVADSGVNNTGESIVGDGVRMVAKITSTADSDRIEVEVTESEYTYGIHIVHISSQTQILDKNGNNLTRSQLKVGDSVEIYYGGQVMMSLPPQISSSKIVLLP